MWLHHVIFSTKFINLGTGLTTSQYLPRHQRWFSSLFSVATARRGDRPDLCRSRGSKAPSPGDVTVFWGIACPLTSTTAHMWLKAGPQTFDEFTSSVVQPHAETKLFMFSLGRSWTCWYLDSVIAALSGARLLDERDTSTHEHHPSYHCDRTAASARGRHSISGSDAIVSSGDRTCRWNPKLQRQTRNGVDKGRTKAF